jgi:hypothetical protein
METESILQRLHTNSIVLFELSEDKSVMDVLELCDLYFEDKLNKKQVGQLIKELQHLHKQMK